MAIEDLTPEQIKAEFDLLRTNPEQYLANANERVAHAPEDANAYFNRHFGWQALGALSLALADLDKSLALERHYVTLRVRGRVLRDLGRYEEAIEDFNQSEAIAPEEWIGASGPLFRADCHARLGNVEAALADVARLPDDHWTPGVFGTPGGNKQQVAAQIEHMALQARGEHIDESR